MICIEKEKVPTLKGIKDFADWWNFNGGFILPPAPLEIYNIDVATTSVIFRHGRFQVEQYLLLNNSGAGLHRHPHIDSVVNANGMLFGKHITDKNVDWSIEPHGAILSSDAVQENGMFFFIAQHWTKPSMPMTTVLCSWDDAPPLSTKHEKLLAWYKDIEKMLLK